MPLEIDAAYLCPYCGETNYVGVDPTAAGRQRFTEDCPVCCSPIAFSIQVEDGEAVVDSAERDE